MRSALYRNSKEGNSRLHKFTQFLIGFAFQLLFKGSREGVVGVIETKDPSGEKLDSRSSLGATLAHVAYNLKGFSRYQRCSFGFEDDRNANNVQKRWQSK